ncbi:WYL domain-containing protein [Virgibacillus sp. JSM 102003]|uniref:WYL domain-containing protein n=1 Tax=Virgibacillus sp. JSM 102003 TaxID=1562108 RepID=UPI0035C164BE
MQQAIWNERKLHMKYERADGKIVERVVDPLGIVAKGSTWYLIASSNEASKLNTIK